MDSLQVLLQGFNTFAVGAGIIFFVCFGVREVLSIFKIL